MITTDTQIVSYNGYNAYGADKSYSVQVNVPSGYSFYHIYAGVAGTGDIRAMFANEVGITQNPCPVYTINVKNGMAYNKNTYIYLVTLLIKN